MIDAARLQSYYSAALQEIEENLSSLQRVRADVNATSKIASANRVLQLAPPILWNRASYCIVPSHLKKV